MRCANKWPHKVKFHRLETLPLYTIRPGVEVVTWNTEKRTIAAKKTTPLPIVITPDEWSRMRRAALTAESWLVDESEQTEEVDAWLV